MFEIKKIVAREVLDSRGFPTVEADLYLKDGSFGRSIVPSGASTGAHEALELRDNDTLRYCGKGVLKAVSHIQGELSQALIGKAFPNQDAFDGAIISLDGTENKSRLGANALLALSLSFAKACAQAKNKDLYEYLATRTPYVMPIPMMNIINGGAHADNPIDIQEFMIMPVGASSFREGLRMGAEVFHALKTILRQKGLATSVGDEGGFAPYLKSAEEALQLIWQAVEHVGVTKEMVLSLDVAATELYDKKTKIYHFKGDQKTYTAEKLVEYYQSLKQQVPIVSIEDGMSEDDWQGWQLLTKNLGNTTQLVGDDLFVTNYVRVMQGIEKGAANAILIKVNQIGTLTETLKTINIGNKHGYQMIMSHRSGETEDTTIADLAVGTGVGQIKTGSLSRSDRLAKYNQLLRIEEALGERDVLYGTPAFRKLFLQ